MYTQHLMKRIRYQNKKTKKKTINEKVVQKYVKCKKRQSKIRK